MISEKTNYHSFSKPASVLFAQENPYEPSFLNGLQFAEITKIYKTDNLKFHVDLRQFNGSILKKVILPGPFYTSTGKLSGLKIPVYLGQRVVVGYVDNRAESPVILQIYSYPGGDKTKYNIDKMTFDPDSFELGHESGHKIQLSNDKTEFKNELKTALEIDYTAIATSNLEKSVLGETLKTFLKEFLNVFINNASTLTEPVGLGTPAQLATTINTALQNLRDNDLDDILSGIMKNG